MHLGNSCISHAGSLHRGTRQYWLHCQLTLCRGAMQELPQCQLASCWCLCTQSTREVVGGRCSIAGLPGALALGVRCSNDTVDEDDMDMVGDAHGLVTAPPHARIYRNRKWVCDATSKYQQYICRAEKCKKQVRTSCRCTMGHWLCNEHLLDHVAKHSKMG